MKIIELPRKWNENEVAERLFTLGITNYRLERDYTETLKDNITTIYYPARVFILDEIKEATKESNIRQELKEREFSKTQEEYLEEINPDPILEIKRRLTYIEKILKIDVEKK